MNNSVKFTNIIIMVIKQLLYSMHKELWLSVFKEVDFEPRWFGIESTLAPFARSL